MDESRLIEIETKLAHQEYLINELNQVMATQQETIDQLQTAMRGFFKSYREQERTTGAADQKPPHY